MTAAVPTKFKVMRGTQRPCRTPDNEPEPDDDRIDPPMELSREARQHWDLVTKQLQDVGLITNVDVTAMAIYCEAYATWADATAEVRRVGAVIKTPSTGYPIQNPYLAIANKAFDQMSKMLVEFGMTPASRTKVSADGPTKKPSNRFAKNGRKRV